MRARRRELAEALDGKFEDHHAELARMLLDQIDALTKPPLRSAFFPAASTASSTASAGTHDASTPSEIQSVKRPPTAITPV